MQCATCCYGYADDGLVFFFRCTTSFTWTRIAAPKILYFAVTMVALCTRCCSSRGECRSFDFWIRNRSSSLATATLSLRREDVMSPGRNIESITIAIFANNKKPPFLVFTLTDALTFQTCSCEHPPYRGRCEVVARIADGQKFSLIIRTFALTLTSPDGGGWK